MVFLLCGRVARKDNDDDVTVDENSVGAIGKTFLSLCRSIMRFAHLHLRPRFLGSELLSREAAKAVTEELSTGTILDETKVQVLYRVLMVFTAEINSCVDSKETGKKRAHQKKSYTLLVPIIESGLASASRLENVKGSDVEGNDAAAGDEEDSAWLDPLWEKVFVLLAHFLSPVRTASHGSYIARSASLLEILHSVISHVPARENGKICVILSSGVESSIEVAQSQANIVDDESTTSEVKRKAKTRGEEALKVFEACYDGLCKLEPQSRSLHELTKKLLKEALPPDSTECVSAADNGLHTDVAVIVCRMVARNTGMERLAIGIFSLLSRLISVDDVVLRREAGSILGRIDVGRVLEEATQRCESAEERAQEAEEHIQELIDEIDDLREENELLHQQILVYSTSSSLS